MEEITTWQPKVNQRKLIDDLQARLRDGSIVVIKGEQILTEVIEPDMIVKFNGEEI
jgi:hypothetical protein